METEFKLVWTEGTSPCDFSLKGLDNRRNGIGNWKFTLQHKILVKDTRFLLGIKNDHFVFNNGWNRWRIFSTTYPINDWPPLLTVDIWITQILISTFIEWFFSKSYERGYDVTLNPVAFPSNWRLVYIMNSEQTVPLPNCKVHFTIHPGFVISMYCNRFQWDILLNNWTEIIIPTWIDFIDIISVITQRKPVQLR